jgi:diketogulonate reductase-like aldo/keto reductase
MQQGAKMQHHRLGTTRRQVPVIGRATWYIETKDRDAAIDALCTGIDLRTNEADTAEMYGSGAAEELVGEAIAGRRDRIFLVAKVLPENNSRSGTIEDFEASLIRFHTGRVDCCLLRWRVRRPLEDAVAASKQLQQAGKILSWGANDVDIPGLREARNIAAKGEAVDNELLYQLDEGATEDAAGPYYEKRGVAVVACSPFDPGSFTGPHTAGGCILQKITASHHAGSPQTGLQFLLRRSGIFAVPKTSASELCHVV